MKRRAHLFALILAAVPAAAWSNGADRNVPSAYERCLAAAAVRESHTDVPNDSIFALARQHCAATRAGLARRPQMIAALDATDATQAANLPDWIGRLRERRQLRAIGLPIPADIGYR